MANERFSFKTTEVQRIVKKAGVITSADLRRVFDVPADAKIFVRVPGGADWSNTNLEIDDEEQAIQVTWKETK